MSDTILNSLFLKIKPLFQDTIVPVKAHPTDSGWDLFAHSFDKLYITENLEPLDIPDKYDKLFIPAGGRALVNSGISATVGPGYEIQVRPRSGLALKNGLTVLNTPGTIDEPYRGALGVIIINHSGQTQVLTKGMKIAQMVVCPVVLCPLVVVSELDETIRGSGGFGSTGV